MTEWVIGIMAGAMTLQEFLHAQERKDLYSRMMARDLTEYKEATGPARPPPKSRNFVAAGLRRYFNQKAGD